MYFPFQNCQNLFYRTIIIEITNKNVKQGSKTLLFPFLTPCDVHVVITHTRAAVNIWSVPNCENSHFTIPSPQKILGTGGC